MLITIQARRPGHLGTSEKGDNVLPGPILLKQLAFPLVVIIFQAKGVDWNLTS